MLHTSIAPAPDAAFRWTTPSPFTVELVSGLQTRAAFGRATMWIGLSGSASVHYRGGSIRLRTGSILVLHEDVAAELRSLARARVLAIDIERVAASGPLEHLPFTGYRELAPGEATIVMQLSSCLPGADAYALSSLAMNLIASLAESHRPLMERCPGPSLARRRRLYEQLQRVRLHMRAHLDRRVAIARLTEIAGFCRWHLTRIYQAVYGCGLCEDHCKMRLEHARSLLDDPKYSVRDIAAATGFVSSASFARAFRRVYQLSATTYRAQRLLNARQAEHAGNE